MSLAEFLTSKYLTEDKSAKKKKKKSRKKDDELGIEVRDTALTFEDPSANLDDEDDDGEAPVPELKAHAGWKRVGDASSSVTTVSNEVSRNTTDNAVGQDDEDEEDELLKAGPGETIHRDASGRRIDIALQLETARRQKEQEERERQRQRKELNMGVVQLEQQRAEKDRLQALQSENFEHEEASRRDEKLRNRQVFNDPAAVFIKPRKHGHSSAATSSTSTSNLQPNYDGPHAPNRFNIKPGYRWDGVDRSTGFEAKWFRAQTTKKDRKTREYALQLDE